MDTWQDGDEAPFQKKGSFLLHLPPRQLFGLVIRMVFTTDSHSFRGFHLHLLHDGVAPPVPSSLQVGMVVAPLLQLICNGTSPAHRSSGK